MKKILIIFLLLLSIQSYAQKEAWHWYFGQGTGLDFSKTRSVTTDWGVLDGIPTAVDGPVMTWEGCFSISDRNGDFLFASDGMTIYNRNLAVMKNGTGLLGNSSASNSGIVVPMPGRTTLYYVITAPAIDGRKDGLRYSIVDLSLDGSLGEVIEKNSILSLGTSGLLASDTYENVTVVGHDNGKDFWLVSLIRSKFLVWRITATGISEPQVFETGVDLGLFPSSWGGAGVIKFSSDGKKLAHCSFGLGYLTITDFNPATGQISNIKSNKTNINYGLYGVEFSASGEYIYLTVAQNKSGLNGLYIEKVDDAVVGLPLVKKLENVSNVQMGPDGRIYGISQYKRESLWVIDDPDEGGKHITEITGVFKGSRLPFLGLPVFNTSFFRLKPTYTKAFYCLGNPAEYTLEINNVGTGDKAVDHLIWDFGDGTPAITDNSITESKTLYKQTHQYETKGMYRITITPYLVNGRVDEKQKVVINADIKECKIITNKMIRHDILPK